MKARIRWWLVGIVMLWCVQVTVALAQSDMPPPEEKFAALKLLSGGIDTYTTQQPPPLLVGLDVALTPGWKIYWRSPGDAGQALELDWKNSTNISDVKIEWPAPTRYVEAWGLEVFGYKNEVVLPLLVWRADPAQESHLELHVRYSVCSDICVPYEESLVMDLPVHAMGTPEEVQKIQEYLARVPKANGAHGFMIEAAVRQEEANGKGILHVSAESMTARFVNPDIFVETETGFRFPKPSFKLTDNSRKVDFAIPYEITLPGQTLAEKQLTLTLADGRKAVEAVQVVPVNFVTESSAPAENISLWVMVALAIVGGFVLNGMPCVLPVLSLKYLSVIKHDAARRSAVRRSFLVTAAGIISSFLLLAGIVISAKEAGMAVGWGFHFQEPSFLIVLSLVMVLFAASMWDLAMFNLPSLWTTKLQEKSTTRFSWVNDFFIGMFATLLATPCSAPFLGTAVGFALARGPEEIALIFAALGVGLSLPYLLGAAFPSITKALPRPGKWMLQVKQVMGVFLLLTALWLIWVVGQQSDMQYAGIVTLVAALILAVLMFGKRLPERQRKVMWVVILLTVFVTAALPHLGQRMAVSSESSPAAESQKTMWQSFAPDQIPELVRQGKTVFVDVTAGWCLTCTANELFVLRKPEVVDALSAPNVVAMRADWTRRDTDIQTYLSRFGRYGIPFTIVYGPGLPGGKPLSELLTTDEVLNAVREAALLAKPCKVEEEGC